MLEVLINTNVSFILFGSFIVLLFLGVPIAYSLGAATLLIIYIHDIPGVFMPQTVYSASDKFPLMAVPFLF